MLANDTLSDGEASLPLAEVPPPALAALHAASLAWLAAFFRLLVRKVDLSHPVYAVIFQDAAFLAGKAFVRYRRAGGVRTSPLPDFFIGAHAAVRDYTLLTRDPGPSVSYFPTVRVIRP